MDRVRVQPRIPVDTLRSVRKVAADHDLTLEKAIAWLLETGMWWLNHRKEKTTDEPRT